MKGDVILLKNFRYRIRPIVEDVGSRQLLEDALCVAMCDRDIEINAKEIEKV
jgi:hypothetical protein